MNWPTEVTHAHSTQVSLHCRSAAFSPESAGAIGAVGVYLVRLIGAYASSIWNGVANGSFMEPMV